MSKKIYVLDTNVYLTDYEALYKFGTGDVLIPLKVLEEVDKQKKRQDGVGLNARNFIRVLDELRAKGNLNKGVRIDKGLGIVRARPSNLSVLPEDFDKTLPDNAILACALTEQQENPTKKVIVVSLDINLRVRCDALGLECESYTENQVVKRTNDIFTGLSKLLVDDQIVERFYAGEQIFLESDDNTKDYKPNQFVILVSSANEKKTALSRFVAFNKPLLKVKEYVKGREGTVFGLTPKNKEQQMAMNLLMDEDVPVVTMMGSAGTGKTLLAIAAALEHVINREGEDTQKYEKIIVSRSVMPMGKDIGFLPGSMEEKMAPWTRPIFDVFSEYYQKRDITKYIEEGVIEISPLAYMRGMNIDNSILIFEEAQNSTPSQMKLLLTRIGFNSKFFISGDLEQFDRHKDKTHTGLWDALQKFQNMGDVGVFEFKPEDVVRNPLISQILKRYEE